ncbi:sensor histidine kinase [Noviherbaspirillum saxi]|uniref:histidine kinase n=1 Tax=Noviherbaspirillum saxi TaxID=2320863 RepID=A0A3A3G3C3_9BURK|nr:sensor histidine kinase [Noviherbaspirillum saxi]RJF95906.1 sensor histidine kinase [Noviherbaspirillum saxi]
MRIGKTTLSARTYLLAWIITPIAIFILADTLTLYRNALSSVNTAYDRMLIASAHSIGDLLRIENGALKVVVPYTALEIYEADVSSRMVYRVSDASGKFLSGDDDLPRYTGKPARRASYPDLVHIYEDQYRGETVRVAALFQPVSVNDPAGHALVQVAETVEHRKALAQKILWETLMHQLILLAVVTLLTLFVVSRATRPLDALRAELGERNAEDLSELPLPRRPKELRTVVDALNELMSRLRRLLDHQQRFVADASHQLRTPLAVLKTQLQSGLRGDAPAEVILKEMSGTVERAIGLANQLLSLAKVEQLRGRGAKETCDLAMLAREVAVDLSSLISEKNLDFELDAEKVSIQSHPWMVSELISNLLHNAIRHTPAGSRMGIRIKHDAQGIVICVWDSGPGLEEEQRLHLFEPFSGSGRSGGSGLGLAICREIVDAMEGVIKLDNRIEDGVVTGMDAKVILPE